MTAFRRLLHLMFLAAFSSLGASASAGPVGRTIAQYKHTRWTIDEGAPTPIVGLAQGRDGFLWIGSGQGLVRFDGKSFETIPPEKQIGDRSTVSVVFSNRDGTIWVGYAAGGVARYSGGVLRDMGAPAPTGYVQRFAQTADGAMWALLGRNNQPLLRNLDGKWEAIGESWGLPPLDGSDLLAARDGTLWVSAFQGLYFLKPRTRHFERALFNPDRLSALAQDAKGDIWASDQSFARAVGPLHQSALPYPVPVGLRSRHIVFDRNGAMWGSSSDLGIYKIDAPRALGEASVREARAKVERFGEAEGLTATGSSNIFEDREGNIWVATTAGLDRFKPVPIIKEPLLANVPQYGSVLLATSWGEVFFGQRDGVFHALPGANPSPVLTGAGEAQALCQGIGRDVWIITHDKAVRFDGISFEEIKRPADPYLYDCAVDRRGTLFLTGPEGIFERTSNGWKLHPLAQDSDTDGAMPLVARKDGSLLAYPTSRSLRLYDLPRYTDITLPRAGALRSLRAIYDRGDATILGGRFGLAKWVGTTFKFVSSTRMPTLRSTYGIVATPQGDTWLLTGRAILKTNSADLERAFGDPGRQLSFSLFDSRDGLPAGGHSYGLREAVSGGDGRLWFATRNGTVWIDPDWIRRNPVPPPVTITSISLDGTPYREPRDVRIPPHVSNVVITFSAVSLGDPDRVHVHYKLEGTNENWNEAGSLRQISYNDLRPGHYRFHVIAANKDGVWNRSGAVITLTVEPTFFQSAMFKLLCAAATLAALWAAYTIRTRQLTARVRERLETRHAERERIARELHDTLLQGFQGLVLRFQSVANRMPSGSELRPPLEHALEQAEEVLTEGRDRVSNLRALEGNVDLAADLTDVIAQVGSDAPLPITVTVEGHARPLEPAVREELLRIGEEAIRNALRHANASKVEIGLVYARHLRLGILDDGAGFPDEVATAGRRPGHFGLVGMTERAQRIGGRLEIATSQGGGTRIQVTVPGRLAYPRGRTIGRNPFVARWE